MTSSQLSRVSDIGRSILVGTVDADGEPSCCRGVGLVASHDLSRVTVFVPVSNSQQVIANVATTRRVAVSTSQPLEHHTIQLKGWTEGVRIAREHEQETVESWMDELSRVLASTGIPVGVTRRIRFWPAYAVDLSVEAVFEQIPGSDAEVSLN